MKKPGEGKGPITWKTVKILAVGGAVMFGLLKYMEARKDAGKTHSSKSHAIFVQMFYFFSIEFQKEKKSEGKQWAKLQSVDHGNSLQHLER